MTSPVHCRVLHVSSLCFVLQFCPSAPECREDAGWSIGWGGGSSRNVIGERSIPYLKGSASHSVPAGRISHENATSAFRALARVWGAF